MAQALVDHLLAQVCLALAGYCRARLAEHHDYVRLHGDDMPDVRDWRWPAS